MTLFFLGIQHLQASVDLFLESASTPGEYLFINQKNSNNKVILAVKHCDKCVNEVKVLLTGLSREKDLKISTVVVVGISRPEDLQNLKSIVESYRQCLGCNLYLDYGDRLFSNRRPAQINTLNWALYQPTQDLSFYNSSDIKELKRWINKKSKEPAQ